MPNGSPLPPSARSVTLRALVLLVAWAGFYGLGCSLAIALLWVPWAQISYGSGPDLGGGLAALGALWLLWGLRPRFRRSAVRDEPLPRERHPKLHALVADVARRAGHAVPNELHLLPQANAYAARRNAFLRRGQSLVAIGLPFLVWLDRAGVEAIIAHELGHHLSGDVRLGPWVHGTRQLMGRALDHLEGSGFWLDLPFVGYARVFMRYSLSVSRAQEVAADAISAKVAGAEAAARALVAIEERSSAWQVYLHTEVEPMLEDGFLPELLSGFRLFEAALEKHRHKLDGAPPAPQPSSQYDTHPTLEERLSALGVKQARKVELSGALDLLDATSEAEEYVLRGMLVDKARPLTALPWEAVGSKLWLPRFRKRLEPYRGMIEQLTPDDLPSAAANVRVWAERLRTGLALFSPEAQRRHVIATFGTWLAVFLADRGFELETLPGWPVRARLGVALVEPFSEVAELFERQLEPEAWSERCALIRSVITARADHDLITPS
jgi:Zn-dependent protease with chaperone function